MSGPRLWSIGCLRPLPNRTFTEVIGSGFGHVTNIAPDPFLTFASLGEDRFGTKVDVAVLDIPCGPLRWNLVG